MIAIDCCSLRVQRLRDTTATGRESCVPETYQQTSPLGNSHGGGSTLQFLRVLTTNRVNPILQMP